MKTLEPVEGLAEMRVFGLTAGSPLNVERGENCKLGEKGAFCCSNWRTTEIIWEGGSKSRASYSRSGSNLSGGGGQIFRDFTNCDFKTPCFAG